jgi:hypothetical protein
VRQLAMPSLLSSTSFISHPGSSILPLSAFVVLLLLRLQN